MLSKLSSVYDPLGLASPFILKGRRIIQKLCHGNTQRGMIKMPADFGRVVESSIHDFSDASEDRYGQASYLRLVNNQGVIHCVLLIRKARVSPLKYASRPRLELVAAALSVKIALLLREQLDIEINMEYFWTDSKVVLGYISSSSKRFKIFVSDRVRFNRDHSDVGHCTMFHLHTIQQMTAQEVSMVSNQVNHSDGSKGQLSLVNLKINGQIRFQQK